MKEVPTIQVEVCAECGKDNWNNELLETSFKKSKKKLWLCRPCARTLADKLLGEETCAAK